jgi:hypothetical protein
VRVAAVAAAVLAIGVGLGTYFALSGGPSVPPVPKAEQNRVLERAKADGVIDGYRVVARGPAYDSTRYEISRTRIEFHFFGNGCGGDASRPACLRVPPLMTIEYRDSATAQAEAIMRVARAQMPKAKIQFFEITTPGG